MKVFLTFILSDLDTKNVKVPVCFWDGFLGLCRAVWISGVLFFGVECSLEAHEPVASSPHKAKLMIEHRYFEKIRLDLRLDPMPYYSVTVKLVGLEDEVGPKALMSEYDAIYKVGYDELLMIRLIERYMDGRLCWQLWFDIEGVCFLYQEYEEGSLMRELGFDRVHRRLGHMKQRLNDHRQTYRYLYSKEGRLKEVQYFYHGDFIGNVIYAYLAEDTLHYKESFYVIGRSSDHSKGYREVRQHTEDKMTDQGKVELRFKEVLTYDVEDQLLRSDFYLYSNGLLTVHEQNKSLFHVYEYEGLDHVLARGFTKDYKFQEDRVQVKYYHFPREEQDKKLFVQAYDATALMKPMATHAAFIDAYGKMFMETVITFTQKAAVAEVLRLGLQTNHDGLPFKEVVKSMHPEGIYGRLYFEHAMSREGHKSLLRKKEIVHQDNTLLGTYEYHYDALGRLVREDFYSPKGKKGLRSDASRSILYYYSNRLRHRGTDLQAYLNSYGQEGFYGMGKAFLEGLLYEHAMSNRQYGSLGYEAQQVALMRSLKWIESLGFSKVIFWDSKQAVTQYIRIHRRVLESGDREIIFRYYNKPDVFHYASEGNEAYYRTDPHIRFESKKSSSTKTLEGSEISRSDFLNAPRDRLGETPYKQVEFLREKIIYKVSAVTGRPYEAEWFRYKHESGDVIEHGKVQKTGIYMYREADKYQKTFELHGKEDQ